MKRVSKNRGRWIGIVTAVLLIGGCTTNEQSSDIVNEPTPSAKIAIEPGKSATPSPEIEDPAVDKVLIPGEPGAIKSFLSSQKIPNGDIYLQDDKVHINIVGLNEEIKRSFAETFMDGGYVLHNVKYTAQELLDAQELLHEEELYQKLNLYGSSVDTIGNKVNITIPDDYAEAAKLEIEKWIDPGMLTYDISELGEPHVVGEIVEIDAEKAKRILILEPGKEQPTYWFSFNEKSEMVNEAGEPLHLQNLKVGQRVRLWSTGMVLESMPAQASVRRMELVE